MDILKLIPANEWLEFTSNYSYNLGFMGDALFGSVKTKNLEATIAQLIQGGDIPVMAQVHSLDAEARIGERPNFETLKFNKLLIKEKLNQTERITEFLNNAPQSAVIDFVFDDANTLISRVLTRIEVAKMEVLGTGKATYKENNVVNTVNYGITPASISAWNDPTHDILGDIQGIVNAAAARGKVIVRAITSSKMIGYMLNNTAIKGFWANKTDPLTKARLLSWLQDNYGIQFVVNDAVYKTSINGTAKRFYPEDTITFLSTLGRVGQAVFGYTPEELKLPNTSEKSLVTITQWETPDPVAVWTKGSALCVPVLTDATGVFIYNHTASTPSNAS